MPIRPNPAHDVLARWQDRFPDYTLVTQNVDGLHQAAGARGVLELHGNIWRVRCAGCGRERLERTVPLPELPPRCTACGALERPGVVWFGEMLPQDVLARAWEAAEQGQVLVVVGTPALVYPAAGLLEVTARHGGTVIEVNPEPRALAFIASIALSGPAGEVLPRLAARVGGPQGAHPNRRVVLFAHIDARIGTPGANDNASGVVALLLLAELLATLFRPSRHRNGGIEWRRLLLKSWRATLSCPQCWQIRRDHSRNQPG